MFNQLGDRLKTALDDLRGRGRLSEADVNDALRNVRIALLEADVALSVVKNFIEGVRKQALGQEVSRSVNPGHLVVKIVHDELVALMGEKNDALDLAVRPPAIILVTGLQGAGKTTTIGKLALHLRSLRGKRILVTSVDIYRPAAIDQLKRLADDVEVAYCDVGLTDPVQMAVDALDYARKKGFDVLIVDTAGRLHVDQKMMLEIKDIHTAIDPTETLFVVDSMTGQDAINSAQAFNEELQF